MIDFYALTSPNVQKIFIMLEEMRAALQSRRRLGRRAVQAGIPQAQSERQDPGDRRHDGPGGKPYTVFESGAILMYLAEKTGKFLPKDMAKKYDVIQWLMVQLTGIGPAFGNFTHFNLFAPKPGNEYSLSRYKNARCCGSTNCWTGASARRRISAARNTRSPTWRRSRGRASTRLTASKMRRNAEFQALVRGSSARPAVKTMIAKHDDIKSSRDTATDDNKDRFFNRGKYARACVAQGSRLIPALVPCVPGAAQHEVVRGRHRSRVYPRSAPNRRKSGNPTCVDRYGL